MNKKGHHEIGFAPYAIIVTLIGVFLTYIKKFFKR